MTSPASNGMLPDRSGGSITYIARIITSRKKTDLSEHKTSHAGERLLKIVDDILASERMFLLAIHNSRLAIIIHGQLKDVLPMVNEYDIHG